MKNILITGTSSGIGLAAAVELAKRGERVFASMRDTSRSHALLAAAAAAGVSVEIVQLDVTDPASVQRAVRDVLAEAGRIDVVVNNAGISLEGPLEFSTEEETMAAFETHVFGPLRLIRAVLTSMRERGGGRIVNVSSLAAHPRFGHRLMGLYSASKAAMSAMTEELCKEVAPLGIQVVLMEGVVGDTAMTAGVARRALTRNPDASPYRVVERIHQRQWANPVAPELAAQSARSIAEACTIADPPFMYPPQFLPAIIPLMPADDSRFVRLCALDPTPELYEGMSRFWQVGRTVAHEEAAAGRN